MTMAKTKTKTKKLKQVEALQHLRSPNPEEDSSRKNIPTAEYQALIEKDSQTPVQVAYDRRNRDLDPQLVWRGKDEQDWSDLFVPAPPLYIQEKIHPKVLIDHLLRRSSESESQQAGANLDLTLSRSQLKFAGRLPEVIMRSSSQ